MMCTIRRSAFVLPLAVLGLSCSEFSSAPERHAEAPPLSPSAWLTRMIAHRLAGAATDAQSYRVLVGAGDIARCYPDDDPLAAVPASTTPAEATAELLDGIPGTVMAVGDNAYQYGSPVDYSSCYDPTWGRHKARTRPAAGNHDYLTPGAAGYFGYFGTASYPPGGYYSYDLGSWHVVVLNSTPQWALCPPVKTSAADGRTCVGDVAQRAWLESDLDAHPAVCTIAYFHHPRFSSGEHGNQYEMQQLWDILYAHGVDVVVSGHDHDYERFAPQDPDGTADPTRGIREFVVGTGGAELRGWGTIVPNSEVRLGGTYGVLALALGDGRYGWAFVDAPGRMVRDAGEGACH